MAKILLAEDNLELALEVQKDLSDLGHSVVLSSSLDAALQKLTHQDFDIVVCDICLCPHNPASPLGGNVILQRARQISQERNRCLPVIAISSGFHGLHMADHLLATAREQGAVASLMKPLDLPELSAAINAALAVLPAISASTRSSARP